MKKKGFVYITTVTIFLIIIVSLFFIHEVYNDRSSGDSIETRIKTIDYFISDLEEDIERAAYISGFRTFIALEEYVSANGVFLDDVEQSFLEAFFNGTIGATSPPILDQSTFSQYISKVNANSNKIGINFNITVSSIELYQIDPWIVGVEINTQVNITDYKGLAEWNFDQTFLSEIPIEDLKDPLYSVKTLGRLPSFVKRTNITDFVAADNSTDELLSHIENSYYNASIRAPSFLMRFEGNLSNDTNGIESIVDISFLEKQEDLEIHYTRSVIDYIYFGVGVTNNKCNVQNMPSWFRIDENHVPDYEIDQLTFTDC
ncbi:MAG: hypothetical protein ABH828_01595 [archaeon]